MIEFLFFIGLVAFVILGVTIVYKINDYCERLNLSNAIHASVVQQINIVLWEVETNIKILADRLTFIEISHSDLLQKHNDLCAWAWHINDDTRDADWWKEEGGKPPGEGT